MQSINDRIVQTIQPTISMNPLGASSDPVHRLRVAAYARVSTDHEEQQSSYEAQVDHYTKKIRSNPEWQFVEVYTDKGITGTNTKKREGFNRMVNDALAGKIDLILTKSVSRFARNTVDTLTTIRKLKAQGVAVYFEEQSIDTMDGKGELLITIMSSIAQEESRSISDNVTWGKRKRAADGYINLPYKNFLGFEKGEDGLPKIVEEEAEIIRFIYRSFLMGKTGTHIARLLTDAGIPTPSRNKTWQESTVMSILQNEKYKGAALLQKCFTVDYLEKRRKVNEGEVPQYYIEHSHEAIIDPIEHERVQLEIRRRKAAGGRYSCQHIFSSRVVCGDCGCYYGRKIWHSNDPYRSIVWRCNDKYHREKKCRTPHITEDALKRCFVSAFNQRLEVSDAALEACSLALEALCDLSDLEAGMQSLTGEIAVVTQLSRQLSKRYAHSTITQEEYDREHTALTQRFNAKDAQLKELQAERDRRTEMQISIRWFMEILGKQDGLLTDFDESLFFSAADVMTVYPDRRVIVRFRDGEEVEVRP